MSMESLKDRLQSSFIVFENELKEETRSPLHSIRRQAMKRFETLGFPSVKLEDWKYTNLKPVVKGDYTVFADREQGLEFSEIKRFFLNELDTYKIVFVDGRYSSWLSSTTHQNYDICTFSAGLRRHREVIDAHFSKAAWGERSLVALNTAFAREGAFVRIPAGKIVEKPIEVMHISTGSIGDSMNQPRGLIVLEEGAEATLIERHQNLGNARVLTNSVTEVFAGAGSQFHYLKIQNDSPTTALIDHTAIVQERDSRVDVGTFVLGGRFVRNELEFKLEGPGANAGMIGLSLVDEDQFVDHHTGVDHVAPHCQSDELYKGVYDGKSQGVFNGRIMVRPGAQKTNAFQQNHNVLLGEKATVDTKPQLEIFADDVKCSHGCTIGQLDEEALFYLRSRGIPAHEAQALLLYAFGEEIIAKVPLPELRQRLSRLMARKLNVDFELSL